MYDFYVGFIQELSLFWITIEIQAEYVELFI